MAHKKIYNPWFNEEYHQRINERMKELTPSRMSGVFLTKTGLCLIEILVMMFVFKEG
jgi:hypothetical protein